MHYSPTYLFVFAHPDDESVACAGTIRQLVDAGNKVVVISVTDGGAGEVSDSVRSAFPDMTTAEIRRSEVVQVQKHLGISEYRILDFKDGEINNQAVWGSLTSSLINQIEEIKPDVLVTFEHGGWYYHLDHVGVSIATTLAYHQSRHRPSAFLLSHFRVRLSKWKYVYCERPQLSYRVLVQDLDAKLAAVDLHASQDLKTPRAQMVEDSPHYENYSLAFGDEKANSILADNPIFEPIIDVPVSDQR